MEVGVCGGGRGGVGVGVMCVSVWVCVGVCVCVRVCKCVYVCLFFVYLCVFLRGGGACMWVGV